MGDHRKQRSLIVPLRGIRTSDRSNSVRPLLFPHHVRRLSDLQRSRGVHISNQIQRQHVTCFHLHSNNHDQLRERMSQSGVRKDQERTQETLQSAGEG